MKYSDTDSLFIGGRSEYVSKTVETFYSPKVYYDISSAFPAAMMRPRSPCASCGFPCIRDKDGKCYGCKKV
jgi:hypothetical protein